MDVRAILPHFETSRAILPFKKLSDIRTKTNPFAPFVDAFGAYLALIPNILEQKQLTF